MLVNGLYANQRLIQPKEWFMITVVLKFSFIMHPVQPSEARLGGVHFIFRHIQILTRLLHVELFGSYYVYCMHM